MFKPASWPYTARQHPYSQEWEEMAYNDRFCIPSKLNEMGSRFDIGTYMQSKQLKEGRKGSGSLSLKKKLKDAGENARFCTYF